MNHLLSIHKSLPFDSTSHSLTGGGAVPTQSYGLLVATSAYSDNQLGLVTSYAPSNADGVKVKNIAQDPWKNHSDISNIVSKIKESDFKNTDNLVLGSSAEKKSTPSLLRASSFFQDTSGQYSIDNPSYAGGGWGSVGGVITSVIGLDTLFSGNWTSPGHVAHDYREVFVSNSADIGNNMIGRPLNDAENQKYGDIVHDRVKHCIKEMGYKNGPSQGWDEAMGIILPDLAHSQAAKDYLNSLYQSVLNMQISDNALNADMNALANKQASMFEIRSDVTHSVAEKEVIAGLYENLANYSASDVQIQGWEDALADGSKTYTSMRDVIGHGGEARNGVIGLYSGLANVSVSEGQIQGWQNALANGSATYDSMRDVIGHGGEARNGVIGLYSGLANVSVSEGQIQGWQNALANGSATYDSMRDVIGHGGEARNAILGLYSSLANVTATEQDIQSWQGVLANGSATYDSMRYGIAHGWEAQGTITGLYSSLTNAAATEQDVQSWQGYLANGSATYEKMRYTIGHGWEASNAIAGLYSSLANVTASDAQIQSWQGGLGNGSVTYNDVRYEIGHGWETRDAIKSFYLNLANVTASEAQIQSWQGGLGNGSVTYNNVKYDIGHGWEASLALKTTFQFATGEQMDDATLKQYEDNMTASGGLNVADSQIVHSSLALTQIQTVYDEWGQLPPDSGALQNAEMAIDNLSHAWIVVAQQNTNDWAAEVSAYQAIAGTAAYGQLVENISFSMQQATSLLASALSDPLMNVASTSEDFRNIVVKGGASLFEAIIDQEDVENNIQAVRQEGDGTPCEPANFKKAHSQDILNCQIAAVNAMPGLHMAGQATDKWANGIQWRSAGGNPQQQGNPFEVWDAQRLKKEGYEWLADYNSSHSNWMAFDEWNAKTQVAVSDKTIDLKAPSYQVMYKIQGRLLSDVEAMLRYQRDGGFYRYNDDSGKVGKQVSFEHNDISHYVLDLGVPSEPTAGQWKAICLALQKAKKRVASQPDAETKTIDFQVKDVI